jgi:hypothetical protein
MVERALYLVEADIVDMENYMRFGGGGDFAAAELAGLRQERMECKNSIQSDWDEVTTPRGCEVVDLTVGEVVVFRRNWEGDE